MGNGHTGFPGPNFNRSKSLPPKKCPPLFRGSQDEVIAFVVIDLVEESAVEAAIQLVLKFTLDFTVTAVAEGAGDRPAEPTAMDAAIDAIVITGQCRRADPIEADGVFPARLPAAIRSFPAIFSSHIACLSVVFFYHKGHEVSRLSF